MNNAVYCEKCHHVHVSGEVCNNCSDPDNSWSGRQGCEGKSVPVSVETVANGNMAEKLWEIEPNLDREVWIKEALAILNGGQQ